MDMFGKKRENGAEPSQEDISRAKDTSDTIARAPARPGPNIPGRPSGGPAIDASSRPMSSAPQRTMPSGGAPQNVAEEKKLIVGNHIRLKGEVTSCDTMIVEGQVELSSSEARQIQISPTGVFLGDVEVDEADISGRFEGGLTARERLLVRASGHVKGRIRYGKIIVESGGTIAGEIGSLEAGGGNKAALTPSAAGTEAKKDSPTPSPTGTATNKAAAV
ncbi:MAG: polymer-forming cytoskeletal protein [Rhodospirillales bacterium]|nr:polymer-forming cytoskeletal protein [Rhodospirillales bacterium]